MKPSVDASKPCAQCVQTLNVPLGKREGHQSIVTTCTQEQHEQSLRRTHTELRWGTMGCGAAREGSADTSLLESEAPSSSSGVSTMPGDRQCTPTGSCAAAASAVRLPIRCAMPAPHAQPCHGICPSQQCNPARSRAQTLLLVEVSLAPVSSLLDGIGECSGHLVPRKTTCTRWPWDSAQYDHKRHAGLAALQEGPQTSTQGRSTLRSPPARCRQHPAP
jgi:hypothetical protein